MPHYKIPSRKFSPVRQFTGKNPLRLAAARAGRTFTCKLSAGGDFSRGDPIIGQTFYGADYVIVRERHINFMIISLQADFFMREAF